MDATRGCDGVASVPTTDHMVEKTHEFDRLTEYGMLMDIGLINQRTVTIREWIDESQLYMLRDVIIDYVNAFRGRLTEQVIYHLWNTVSATDIPLTDLEISIRIEHPTCDHPCCNSAINGIVTLLSPELESSDDRVVDKKIIFSVNETWGIIVHARDNKLRKTVCNAMVDCIENIPADVAYAVASAAINQIRDQWLDRSIEPW